MKKDLKGLEAWLPENGPQTPEEWFDLEVNWAVTYLTHNISIPANYFSPGVIEEAKKQIG